MFHRKGLALKAAESGRPWTGVWRGKRPLPVMVKLLIHDFLDNLVQAARSGLETWRSAPTLMPLARRASVISEEKSTTGTLCGAGFSRDLAGQGMAVHFRHFDIRNDKIHNFRHFRAVNFLLSGLGPGPVWKDIPRPPCHCWQL